MRFILAVGFVKFLVFFKSLAYLRLKKHQMIKNSLLSLLVLSVVTLASFVTAQQVSSVIISGTIVDRDIIIETVHPNYESEVKKMDIDESELLVEIKKELDLWLKYGYIIESANSNSISQFYYRYTYVLTKRED